ncbi:MAG: transketolase [Chitinophagaceae bacterium]|nr:transketolase [Chitinophagaceae bacterium]
MQAKLTSGQIALAAAKRIVTLAYEKKASHIGGALSVKDILAVLYADILRYDPAVPGSPGRDRLFYSKGHACMALYAVLCETGFFNEDMLNTFTADGSYFTSHVNHKVPGIELSTGSLGHAFGVACGVALAANRKHQSHRVYVILSDGELDEGSNWEAFLFAAHHRLSNMVVIIDYNKVQSFGTVNEVMGLEPLADKLRSFGWDTTEIDGHDHEALRKTFASAAESQKPVAVIAHTIKGKGVSFMEGKLEWHYKSPSSAQWQEALASLEQNNV